MASDFLPFGHALPGEHVEHADSADERAVGGESGAQHLTGGDLAIDQEGEVAPDRLKIGGFERATCAPAPEGGNGVEVKLEARDSRVDAKPREKVGVELSEHAEHRLGPERERARAAGMKP